jgi:uncharacterized protein YerC
MNKFLNYFKKEKINYKDYYIKDTSIFQTEEMGELFYKFLKTEYNTEPYDFIKECNEIKSLKSIKEKLEKIKLIFETFIKEDSKKQINLSGETLSRIIKEYEKLTEDENEEFYNDFYNKTVKSIKIELINDSFPRFTRWESCKEALVKYISNEDIVIHKKQLQYPYSDMDFQKWIVTEKDISFLDEVTRDSYIWSLSGTMKKKNITANYFYLSNLEKMLPGYHFSKTLCFAKIDLIVSFNILETYYATLPLEQHQKVFFKVNINI